jgi:glycosyltransferase 2 family protein
MQKRLISLIKYVVFLGLAFFLVWWSVHKMDDKNYNEFINSLKTANYYLVIPVFFLLTASHVSRALRWKVLMKSMGYNPRFSNTFCAVMVGYLANFAVPRLGEVLKCTILGKYEKVPPDKLVGTILVERAVDMFSFFIVIIISLLTQAKIVGAYAKAAFDKYFLSDNIAYAVIKIAIVLVVLIAAFFLLQYIFKKYQHINFIKKIKSIYDGVVEGLLSVKNLKNKWQFILHSVFIWVCYVMGTYIGFSAISETAALPFLASFPVLAFGTVATIVTAGGIGLYPILLMEAMQLYDIPESYGSANGWLQWSAQFVIILVVGFICLLLLPYLNKSKNEIGTIDTP